ncbi:MAG: TonB-dependent receptor [Flavobacteriaceae bacterium]
MKHIVFVLLLFFSWNTFSQNTFSIKATVNTASKDKISVGDALLYKNNKIVKYTSVNEGSFSFDAVTAGNYVLKVLCVGYEPYERKLTLKKNEQLELVLKESSVGLDEVTITATKKVLENKGGNITANVEGTMLSKEISTIELLSKLPNMQVSPDGEQISILGKGNPLIYIGGQRISVDELQALQVDDIKSIQIINNPSVKYEAEGRAVLLITKRRNRGEGTRLTFTERASSKTFFNNNLGSNLMVKKGGLEYRLNAAYNQLKVWEKNSAVYEVTDKNVFSDYEVEAVTTRPQYVFGGGLYYAINDSDYISFNSRYRTQTEPFTIDTNTFLDDNGTIQNINTDSENEGKRILWSSNVNYFHAFSKNKHLFLGAQYTDYTRNVRNSIENTVTNTGSIDNDEISQDFNVQSVVLKGDYDVAYEAGTKLELGFNYAQNDSESLLNLNSIQSSYRYKESIQGLYSQFSGGKKKFSYSFGLRVENTKVEGGFVESNNLLVDRENTFLFPRGNLDFTLSEERSINFSYARSISRPNYSTAVTTTAFINPALEFRGNINLKPTITDDISTNLQMKDKSITLRYFKRTNPVNFRFFYDTTQDITVMSPTNFDEEIGWALQVSLPFKYKFWTSNNTVSMNYNTVKDSRVDKGITSPYIYLYTNQQFKINNTSSFNLNGWVLTNRKDGVFNRRAVFTLNAGYTTKLFDKLDVTLSANDLLNTMEFRDSYILQNLNVSNLFFTDVHEFSIALRYVFGTVKNSQYKNKAVDEELNRMN